MSALAQFAALTAMNLKSAAHRPGGSLVIMIGIMGVVLVLASILTLGAGLEKTVRSTGARDRAIVLRAGIDSEAGSTLFVDETQSIMDAPGIARTPQGEPIATADMVSAINLPRKDDGSRAGVTIRGMTGQGLSVRPEIHLVAGRWYAPGLSEVVVGCSAQKEFRGLGLGEKIRLRGGEWTVVGVFESGNGLEGFSLGATEGSVVAQLRVTLPILATGLVWACAAGFVGGLLPAIRTARMQVANALKAE